MLGKVHELKTGVGAFSHQSTFILKQPSFLANQARLPAVKSNIQPVKWLAASRVTQSRVAKVEERHS